MDAATSQTEGRRERNKREKRDRIFAAAAELFAERGFEDVTTQQIAERADVGAGTLFRYAATKGELFLMVYNVRLAAAVHEGAAAAADETDVAAAICAMVRPSLEWALDLGDSADYQRELLFGPPDEEYRAEGLATVADLEARIAARLEEAAPPGANPADARRAARSVFAVLNLLLVQPLNQLHPDLDAPHELCAQVTQIVRGYLAAVGATAGPGDA
ncbi:helix-turn-helix domain-containing protein [Demequina capsici]|uniref:Helix-turn-helix domain-containing protein n=1 Tax=Demequina capsici TaxID=3075620 RepID=A0AA96J9D0_9MICO|nr:MULTISPECIES: helix-turn-helix domain-containing protein [unclassified Demequina]WNM24340.1 helix-turn-helix domain-containing protein [Demequina sp. OYTSA14]WNM27162.1 helix-turn-helix domain-containing protein [Demequina sp. PMTSA13]